MRLKEWLEFFRQHSEVKIFGFQHLKLLTGSDAQTLRMALKRLADQKAIRRICRGFYANLFSQPTFEDISSVIYKPSYISLESALSRYGIMNQMPQVLSCVTPKLPRQFRTSFGVIQYRQMKKEYFFGFVKERNHWIAEPEKALVDYVYLNKRKNLERLMSEFDLSELRSKKYKQYAARLGVAGVGIER